MFGLHPKRTRPVIFGLKLSRSIRSSGVGSFGSDWKPFTSLSNPSPPRYSDPSILRGIVILSLAQTAGRFAGLYFTSCEGVNIMMSLNCTAHARARSPRPVHKMLRFLPITLCSDSFKMPHDAQSLHPLCSLYAHYAHFLPIFFALSYATIWLVTG